MPDEHSKPDPAARPDLPTDGEAVPSWVWDIDRSEYETDIEPIDHRPPPPFDEADFRRALRLIQSPEEADQIVDDYCRDGGLHQPGAMWVGDTLLYVALLSPEHEERMREYLAISPERMRVELERVRRSLPSSATRPSTP